MYFAQKEGEENWKNYNVFQHASMHNFGKRCTRESAMQRLAKAGDATAARQISYPKQRLVNRVLPEFAFGTNKTGNIRIT